jgi:hypothetical protein
MTGKRVTLMRETGAVNSDLEQGRGGEEWEDS